MLPFSKVNHPKGFLFKRVFRFAELSDTAKEKARDWWRRCENETFDAVDLIRDDVERIAGILGIRFESHSVHLMSGKTRQEPNIWYSGFYSQGDGACFDASYAYAKGCAKAIRAYAPQDKRLHAIADELQRAQASAFYHLEASARHLGHYYHSGCMQIEVSRTDNRDVTHEQYAAVESALRSFADWIYRQLETEYEFRMSDKNVDESIICNEYRFTRSGSIA
jgi:hypothetical protein